MRKLAEDQIRTFAVAMVLAMIFAVVVFSLSKLILLSIAIPSGIFLLLTRNHVGLCYAVGLEVQWRAYGEDRKGIVLATNTPGYLTVREAPYGRENVPLELIRFGILDRVKYSWRREKAKS